MKIGVLKETLAGEARVAATPETVKKYIGLGCDVLVETGAGLQANYSDENYTAEGAKIVSSASELIGGSDLVIKVNPLNDEELSVFKEGSFFIGFLNALSSKELLEKIAAKKISGLAMEMVPRIARAQKLDALSSQSNIAGYKSVILAADQTSKFFPMLMTAAGTIQPAKVLVLGAGVAGLQAIATAKRLGAVVEAFDTRPVVKEQVESLGGKFIELDTGEESEDSGGYAKELSEEQHKQELELVAEHSRQADVVITTALIPGKPAPVLVTEETVKAMKPGSVIVDMAAGTGGNCVLSKPDEIVEVGGVKIVGYTNLPSLMAQESSQLYSRNVYNLFTEIFKDGKVELDFEDDIVKGACVTHDGAVRLGA